MNEKAFACGISIIALFLVAALIPVSAQPAADSFGVNDAGGTPGTQVLIPVKITNVKNGSILGIIFNIAYDKSVINITTVVRGDLTSDWNVLDFNNDFEGGTRVTLAGPSAFGIPNGSSGSVALLNFSVERTADRVGYSHITVSDIQLSDPEGNLGTAPARNGLFYVAGITTPGGSGDKDTDGDGYSDIDEMFVGTDLKDTNSYPGSDAPAIVPAWAVPSTTITTIPTPPALTPAVSPLPVAQKQTWPHICLIGIGLALIIIGVLIYYFYIRKKA